MRVSLAALLTVAVVMWHPPLLDGRAEQTRAGLVEIAFVANAEAGTVALLDVASRSVLGSIDVNAARDTAGGPGSPNYAQDTDISPDGQSLFVSAMLVNRVYRISTATSEITGHVVTGVYPHDTKVSKDGERIYDTSLGPMASFPRPADAPPLTETPGYPFQLTIADAGTLEVRDRIRLDSAIRPWQFTPDEQGLYAQLSNEHAVVAYDLGARRVVGRLDLPVSDGVTAADWDFEAPHHGLALTPDGRTLCVAGRASDYAALVRAPDLTLIATIPVGDAPGWSETAEAGRLCLVANSRSDDLSIISIAERSEIVRLPIGNGPKHITVARVPAAVVEAFKRGQATGR